MQVDAERAGVERSGGGSALSRLQITGRKVRTEDTCQSVDLFSLVSSLVFSLVFGLVCITHVLSTLLGVDYCGNNRIIGG